MPSLRDERDLQSSLESKINEDVEASNGLEPNTPMLLPSYRALGKLVKKRFLREPYEKCWQLPQSLSQWSTELAPIPSGVVRGHIAMKVWIHHPPHPTPPLVLDSAIQCSSSPHPPLLKASFISLALGSRNILCPEISNHSPLLLIFRIWKWLLKEITTQPESTS